MNKYFNKELKEALERYDARQRVEAAKETFGNEYTCNISELVKRCMEEYAKYIPEELHKFMKTEIDFKEMKSTTSLDWDKVKEYAKRY